MIEIKKSKDIRIKFAWSAFFVFTLLTSLGYFLGWEFELSTFLIYVCFIVSEFFILWLVCVILIKFDKSYYRINEAAILLLKKNETILSIEAKDIIRINYIRFFWTFLLQFGSGYLNITYLSKNNDEKKISTILPTGERVHSISMSLKQAKEVSKILKINLEVK